MPKKIKSLKTFKTLAPVDVRPLAGRGQRSAVPALGDPKTVAVGEPNIKTSVARTSPPDALTALKRPTLHEVMGTEEQRDFARKSIDKIREMQGATLVKYWTDRNGLVSDERQVADNATQLAAAKAGIDIMGLAPSKFADTKGSQVIIVNIIERDQPNRPTNVIDIEAKSAD